MKWAWALVVAYTLGLGLSAWLAFWWILCGVNGLLRHLSTGLSQRAR